MTEALVAQNVTVRLGRTTIVHGASFALRGGEFAAMVGPNGAGKTTLMRALAGLTPAGGVIALGGRALGALTDRERARHVAYLPQGHVFYWPMPVAAIVMLGRTPHADPFTSTSAQDRAAVEHALVTTETMEFAERAVIHRKDGL